MPELTLPPRPSNTFMVWYSVSPLIGRLGLPMTGLTSVLAGQWMMEILGAAGATEFDMAVIEALQTSSHPLSHDEIGAALAADGIAHDRVTLYRALDWLVEQGIAPRIAGGERAWRFEIRRGDEHRHAHFHCDRCGQILCLEDVPAAASPALPAGFELDRAELVLHGACADCGRAGLKRPAQ